MTCPLIRQAAAVVSRLASRVDAFELRGVVDGEEDAIVRRPAVAQHRNGPIAAHAPKRDRTALQVLIE